MAWDAEVNLQDSIGHTPLHLSMACEGILKNFSLLQVKQLITKGASRSIAEENGFTPFDFMCKIEEDAFKRDELK